jgi:hypothetical protein
MSGLLKTEIFNFARIPLRSADIASSYRGALLLGPHNSGENITGSRPRRSLIDFGHVPMELRPDRGGKMRTRKLRMQRKVKRQQAGSEGQIAPTK